MPRVFIPYGEWKPDLSDFANDGLLEASGVSPLGDSYVPSPTWLTITGVIPTTPTGHWIHNTDAGAGFVAYIGSDTKLYEFNTTNIQPWNRVDKTRTVGGNYGAAPAYSGWQGASFGDSVIMTNYTDDPQLLTSPAAANFVKLASSTFDPKARFAFPIRNNLFLAYLSLAAPFDTLPAGANPFTVCWSASDNVRQFGSYAVTPQLTGTGYQTLAFDLGYITGGVGGQYGLIALQRGWVRIDGPPYTFRPISEGAGCIYPNSIVRMGDDVYFWGAGGPMVLRDGDGRAISLTANRLTRALIDRIGYPATAYRLQQNPPYISAAADNVNNLVWFSYVPSSAVHPPKETFLLVYDITNDRFALTGQPRDANSGVHYLGSVPVPVADTLFSPGRDLVGVLQDDTSSTNYYIGQPTQALGTRVVTMTTGFRRLNDDLTTRIMRARLVYSNSVDSPNPGDDAAFTVYSKNKPYDIAGGYGPYTTLDTHGGIPTPTTVFADFHKIKMTFEPVTILTLEIVGVEVDYTIGPTYSA